MGEKQEKIAKNNEGEKKSDGGVNTIVLKFDMHCEGCAKKVRKSINKLEGVESVKTDVSNNKLMVTGKVDPVMVKEKVEEKMKKKAELVSLQPNKAAKEGGSGGGSGGGDNGGKKKSDDKKPGEKKSLEEKPDDKKKSEGKSDDKKKSEDKEKPKEPPVATVQLKTRVHCEGCAQKIKKIVRKCEGVQDVNVDLQKDLITTKGTMNMKDLLPYLNVKLKRAVELAPTKKDQGVAGDKKAKDDEGAARDKKAKDAGKENEKPKEGGGKSEKPKGLDNADKKDNSGDKKEGGGDKKEGGGGEKKKSGNNGAEASSSKDNSSRIEVSRMEYNPYGYDHAYSYAYDPRQHRDGYGHQVVEYWHAPEFSEPPQMFSDENPNACSLM